MAQARVGQQMTRPDITDRNAEIVARWMAGENRADICRVMDLRRHIVNRALVGLERTGITERDAKIVAMHKAGKQPCKRCGGLHLCVLRKTGRGGRN